VRAPPSDHWEDTLPEADRERYRAAWAEFRCCRDCRNWTDDGDGAGACGLVRHAAFLTPEDYTCDRFAEIEAV
jgi:hypothetical protein